MAQYTILYWQDIPSLVEVRQGRKRHKVQLSERFQELIDKVAMRKGLFGTDNYLEEWRRGEPLSRDGSPEEVVQQVAAEIESEYGAIEERAMKEAAEARAKSDG